MTGFFAGLTTEQKKQALDYRGEENLLPYPNYEGKGNQMKNIECILDFIASMAIVYVIVHFIFKFW